MRHTSPEAMVWCQRFCKLSGLYHLGGQFAGVWRGAWRRGSRAERIAGVGL